MAGYAKDGPPASIAIALGRAIKLARKDKGIHSQAELADLTGEGESVIAKAETGTRVPTREVLAAIVSALSIKGPLLDLLEDVWWLARQQADPLTAQTVSWFEMEALAHTLRYWAPTLIPGFAQTEDYARVLFAAWGNDTDTVNEQVARRAGRHDILAHPDAPDITIIVWERVLDSLIGSPEIMRGQVARLLELAEHPRVHVQVLPADGTIMGLGGAISLASTDTDEVLLVEATEDTVTTDPSRVRRASTTFNSVRADAYRQTESRAILLEALERWSSKTSSGGSPATAEP